MAKPDKTTEKLTKFNWTADQQVMLAEWFNKPKKAIKAHFSSGLSRKKLIRLLHEITLFEQEYFTYSLEELRVLHEWLLKHSIGELIVLRHPMSQLSYQAYEPYIPVYMLILDGQIRIFLRTLLGRSPDNKLMRTVICDESSPNFPTHAKAKG